MPKENISDSIDSVPFQNPETLLCIIGYTLIQLCILVTGYAHRFRHGQAVWWALLPAF